MAGMEQGPYMGNRASLQLMTQSAVGIEEVGVSDMALVMVVVLGCYA